MQKTRDRRDGGQKDESYIYEESWYFAFGSRPLSLCLSVSWGPTPTYSLGLVVGTCTQGIKEVQGTLFIWRYTNSETINPYKLSGVYSIFPK